MFEAKVFIVVQRQIPKGSLPQIHGEAADDLEWKLLCNEMLPRVMAMGYVGLGTTLTYLLPTV